MEFKTLATDEKIPVLGLGTWRMGGGLAADRALDQKYIEAMRYAINHGITHIDTAEFYGAGHAEELVAQAIKPFDRKKLFIRRKTLFITTKVSPQHLFLQSQIRKACVNSLKRLQTDYADLYLVHWPNPLASMKNVMNTFDELVKEGKVRHIGVSNFSVHQLINAQKHTRNKIVCNQVHFSLLHRDPEKSGLLKFCQKEKIILTAYSPLEIGKLAQHQSDVLAKLTKKYHKTQVQIALRWLIEKPQVITIPKASSKEHIDELLGALGWKMTKADQEYLEKEF